MLHFSKVLKAMTFRSAFKAVGPTIDAMCGPETVKNPLFIEPCGADGRSYRHRGPGHIFAPTAKGWVTAVSSLAAHPFAGDGVPSGYVVDAAELRAKEYAAVPDGMNGDVCLVVESAHYARPGGDRVALDERMCATWAHLVDAPTPAQPRCGTRGYGLNVDGARAAGLLERLRAACRAPPAPGRMPLLRSEPETPAKRRKKTKQATAAKPGKPGAPEPTAQRSGAPPAKRRFCMAAALSPSEDADGDPTIDVDAETSAGSVRYCGAA